MKKILVLFAAFALFSGAPKAYSQAYVNFERYLMDLGLEDDNGHLIYILSGNLKRDSSGSIYVADGEDLGSKFSYGEIEHLLKNGYQLITTKLIDLLKDNCTFKTREVPIPDNEIDIPSGAPLWTQGQWMRELPQGAFAAFNLQGWIATVMTNTQILYQGPYSYDGKQIHMGTWRINVDNDSRLLYGNDGVTLRKVAPYHPTREVVTYTSKINGVSVDFADVYLMTGEKAEDCYVRLVKFGKLSRDYVLWKRAEEEDTIDGYISYLEDAPYPTKIRADKAKKAIMDMDDDIYYNLKASNDAEGLLDYIALADRSTYYRHKNDAVLYFKNIDDADYKSVLQSYDRARSEEYIRKDFPTEYKCHVKDVTEFMSFMDMVDAALMLADSGRFLEAMGRFHAISIQRGSSRFKIPEQLEMKRNYAAMMSHMLTRESDDMLTRFCQKYPQETELVFKSRELFAVMMADKPLPRASARPSNPYSQTVRSSAYSAAPSADKFIKLYRYAMTLETLSYIDGKRKSAGVPTSQVKQDYEKEKERISSYGKKYAAYKESPKNLSKTVKMLSEINASYAPMHGDVISFLERQNYWL